MAKFEDEPTPRFWHQAFSHEGQVYVRGGMADKFNSDQNTLTTTLKHFDPVHETWQGMIKTEGVPHPGLTQVARVCVDDILYMYGSHERKVLSQLDLQKFVWSQLWDTVEKDDGKTPMVKAAAGMVHFSGGHLALFGGYASPSGPLQPGSECTPNPYETNKGWTNEFHLFNISKRVWLTPTIKGTRPPACADFALNGVNLHRAVLFGGYQHNLSQEELYIIDFHEVKMEIVFTKIEKQKVWPPGRECHTGCCLGLNTERPQFLISGGKNIYDIPLKFDMWTLDLKSFVWRKVKLPSGTRSKRWGQSMTTVVACPGLEAVIIFGGSPAEFGATWRSPGFPKLAETTIYSFGHHDQDWVLLDEQICGRSSLPILEWEKFEFNCPLSMKAIFSLEKRYGIPLLSEISNKQKAFQQEIQMSQREIAKKTKQEGVIPSIDRWLKLACEDVMPTWQNLFLVLHRIDLGDLAWQMVDCILKAMIDTAKRLEDDLFTHYDAVLEKEDYFRHKIESFVEHSDATIAMFKEKYDQLRDDIDQLKEHLTSNQAGAEHRGVTSTATVKHTDTVKDSIKTESKDGVKTEHKDEVICVKIEPEAVVKPELKFDVKTEPVEHISTIGHVQRNGKQEYAPWTDPSEVKIQLLKKENQLLKDRLEKLEWHQSNPSKIELSPHPTFDDFDLRGVDVCGETAFVVTNNADEFRWKKYGLTLHICENSLPKDVEKCTISIKASVAGQYQFPENFHLVSAIFWFRPKPMCKFTKSITMEMEHCAKSENFAKLSFMRANCTQEKLPYTFKKIGGHFTSERHIGSIELNGFSGEGIVQEVPPNKHKDSVQYLRKYSAMIFHCIHQKSISYRIDFVVTWNTKTHLAAIKQEYDEEDAELDFDQIIEFESNSIKLDIPDEGVTTQGGWTISPFGPPVILKHNVDSYELGTVIPKCRFLANVTPQGDSIPPLKHRVKLIGTKLPYDYLTFNISPDAKKRSFSESDAPPAKRKKLEHKSRSLDTQTAGSSSTFIEAAAQPIVTPNLKISNLMAFKWRNKRGEVEKFRVIPQILDKWKDIGSSMGISYQQLEVWEREKDAKDRCRAVLNHWLEGNTEYPATWEGLYEILDDCELRQAAVNLKLAIDNAV